VEESADDLGLVLACESSQRVERHKHDRESITDTHATLIE
jgi:hypothetical protein